MKLEEEASGRTDDVPIVTWVSLTELHERVIGQLVAGQTGEKFKGMGAVKEVYRREVPSTEVYGGNGSWKPPTVAVCQPPLKIAFRQSSSMSLNGSCCNLDGDVLETEKLLTKGGANQSVPPRRAGAPGV